MYHQPLAFMIATRESRTFANSALPNAPMVVDGRAPRARLSRSRRQLALTLRRASIPVAPGGASIA